MIHNPYIYDGWEQPERAKTRCRRHSGLQPRYGSGHWIASLIPIPIGPLHAQVCKFNINIRKSSLYHDFGKINRNRGAFIHFSDLFHVTRLYQCNPHVSYGFSLTASLAILVPRHDHHFSRFQRLENLRALSGRADCRDLTRLCLRLCIGVKLRVQQAVLRLPIASRAPPLCRLMWAVKKCAERLPSCAVGCALASGSRSSVGQHDKTKKSRAETRVQTSSFS